MQNSLTVNNQNNVVPSGANHTLLTYVRNKRNKRVGVVVATKLVNDPSKVGIGWSLAAVNKGDKFDPSKGLMIALNRANNGSNVNIPESIHDHIIEMRGRAIRYFKQSEVID